MITTAMPVSDYDAFEFLRVQYGKDSSSFGQGVSSQKGASNSGSAFGQSNADSTPAPTPVPKQQDTPSGDTGTGVFDRMEEEHSATETNEEGPQTETANRGETPTMTLAINGKTFEYEYNKKTGRYEYWFQVNGKPICREYNADLEALKRAREAGQEFNPETSPGGRVGTSEEYNAWEMRRAEKRQSEPTNKPEWFGRVPGYAQELLISKTLDHGKYTFPERDYAKITGKIKELSGITPDTFKWRFAANNLVKDIAQSAVVSNGEYDRAFFHGLLTPYTTADAVDVAKLHSRFRPQWALDTESYTSLVQRSVAVQEAILNFANEHTKVATQQQWGRVPTDVTKRLGELEKAVIDAIEKERTGEKTEVDELLSPVNDAIISTTNTPEASGATSTNTSTATTPTTSASAMPTVETSPESSATPTATPAPSEPVATPTAPSTGIAPASSMADIKATFAQAGLASDRSMQFIKGKPIAQKTYEAQVREFGLTPERKSYTERDLLKAMWVRGNLHESTGNKLALFAQAKRDRNKDEAKRLLTDIYETRSNTFARAYVKHGDGDLMLAAFGRDVQKYGYRATIQAELAYMAAIAKMTPEELDQLSATEMGEAKKVRGLFESGALPNPWIEPEPTQVDDIIDEDAGQFEKLRRDGEDIDWLGILGSTKTAMLKASDIQVHPADYQYKTGVDKVTGANQTWVDERKEHGFIPGLSEAIDVWKDPETGAYVCINGHHRLALAKATGWDGDISVHIHDVQTKDEARVLGALLNIQQRKGSPIDAATILREMDLPDAVRDALGFNTEGSLGRQALGVAQLEDGLYNAVLKKKLSPVVGGVIGETIRMSPETLPDGSVYKIENAADKQRDCLRYMQNHGLDENTPYAKLKAVALTFRNAQYTEDTNQPTFFSMLSPDAFVEASANLQEAVRSKLNDQRSLAGLIRKRGNAAQDRGLVTGVDNEGAKAMQNEGKRALRFFDHHLTYRKDFHDQYFSEQVQKFLDAQTGAGTTNPKEAERKRNDVVDETVERLIEWGRDDKSFNEWVAARSPQYMGQEAGTGDGEEQWGSSEPTTDNGGAESFSPGGAESTTGDGLLTGSDREDNGNQLPEGGDSGDTVQSVEEPKPITDEEALQSLAPSPADENRQAISSQIWKAMTGRDDHIGGGTLSIFYGDADQKGQQYNIKSKNDVSEILRIIDEKQEYGYDSDNVMGNAENHDASLFLNETKELPAEPETPNAVYSAYMNDFNEEKETQETPLEETAIRENDNATVEQVDDNSLTDEESFDALRQEDIIHEQEQSPSESVSVAEKTNEITNEEASALITKPLKDAMQEAGLVGKDSFDEVLGEESTEMDLSGSQNTQIENEKTDTESQQESDVDNLSPEETSSTSGSGVLREDQLLPWEEGSPEYQDWEERKSRVLEKGAPLLAPYNLLIKDGSIKSNGEPHFYSERSIQAKITKERITLRPKNLPGGWEGRKPEERRYSENTPLYNMREYTLTGTVLDTNEWAEAVYGVQFRNAVKPALYVLAGLLCDGGRKKEAIAQELYSWLKQVGSVYKTMPSKNAILDVEDDDENMRLENVYHERRVARTKDVFSRLSPSGLSNGEELISDMIDRKNVSLHDTSEYIAGLFDKDKKLFKAVTEWVEAWDKQRRRFATDNYVYEENNPKLMTEISSDYEDATKNAKCAIAARLHGVFPLTALGNKLSQRYLKDVRQNNTVDQGQSNNQGNGELNPVGDTYNDRDTAVQSGGQQQRSSAVSGDDSKDRALAYLTRVDLGTRSNGAAILRSILDRDTDLHNAERRLYEELERDPELCEKVNRYAEEADKPRDGETSRNDNPDFVAANNELIAAIVNKIKDEFEISSETKWRLKDKESAAAETPFASNNPTDESSLQSLVQEPSTKFDEPTSNTELAEQDTTTEESLSTESISEPAVDTEQDSEPSADANQPVKTTDEQSLQEVLSTEPQQQEAGVVDEQTSATADEYNTPQSTTVDTPDKDEQANIELGSEGETDETEEEESLLERPISYDGGHIDHKTGKWVYPDDMPAKERAKIKKLVAEAEQRGKEREKARTTVKDYFTDMIKKEFTSDSTIKDMIAGSDELYDNYDKYKRVKWWAWKETAEKIEDEIYENMENTRLDFIAADLYPLYEAGADLGYIREQAHEAIDAALDQPRRSRMSQLVLGILKERIDNQLDRWENGDDEIEPSGDYRSVELSDVDPLAPYRRRDELEYGQADKATVKQIDNAAERLEAILEGLRESASEEDIEQAKSKAEPILKQIELLGGGLSWEMERYDEEGAQTSLPELPWEQLASGNTKKWEAGKASLYHTLEGLMRGTIDNNFLDRKWLRENPDIRLPMFLEKSGLSRSEQDEFEQWMNKRWQGTRKITVYPGESPDDKDWKVVRPDEKSEYSVSILRMPASSWQKEVDRWREDKKEKTHVEGANATAAENTTLTKQDTPTPETDKSFDLQKATSWIGSDADTTTEEGRRQLYKDAEDRKRDLLSEWAKAEKPEDSESEIKTSESVEEPQQMREDTTVEPEADETQATSLAKTQEEPQQDKQTVPIKTEPEQPVSLGKEVTERDMQEQNMVDGTTQDDNLQAKLSPDGKKALNRLAKKFASYADPENRDEAYDLLRLAHAFGVETDADPTTPEGRLDILQAIVDQKGDALSLLSMGKAGETVQSEPDVDEGAPASDEQNDEEQFMNLASSKEEDNPEVMPAEEEPDNQPEQSVDPEVETGDDEWNSLNEEIEKYAGLWQRARSDANKAKYADKLKELRTRRRGLAESTGKEEPEPSFVAKWIAKDEELTKQIQARGKSRPKNIDKIKAERDVIRKKLDTYRKATGEDVAMAKKKKGTKSESKSPLQKTTSASEVVPEPKTDDSQLADLLKEEPTQPQEAETSPESDNKPHIVEEANELPQETAQEPKSDESKLMDIGKPEALEQPTGMETPIEDETPDQSEKPEISPTENESRDEAHFNSITSSAADSGKTDKKEGNDVQSPSASPAVTKQTLQDRYDARKKKLEAMKAELGRLGDKEKGEIKEANDSVVALEKKGKKREKEAKRAYEVWQEKVGRAKWLNQFIPDEEKRLSELKKQIDSMSDSQSNESPKNSKWYNADFEEGIMDDNMAVPRNAEDESNDENDYDALLSSRAERVDNTLDVQGAPGTSVNGSSIFDRPYSYDEVDEGEEEKPEDGVEDLSIDQMRYIIADMRRATGTDLRKWGEDGGMFPPQKNGEPNRNLEDAVEAHRALEAFVLSSDKDSTPTKMMKLFVLEQLKPSFYVSRSGGGGVRKDAVLATEFNAIVRDIRRDKITETAKKLKGNVEKFKKKAYVYALMREAYTPPGKVSTTAVYTGDADRPPQDYSLSRLPLSVKTHFANRVAEYVNSKTGTGATVLDALEKEYPPQLTTRERINALPKAARKEFNRGYKRFLNDNKVGNIISDKYADTVYAGTKSTTGEGTVLDELERKYSLELSIRDRIKALPPPGREAFIEGFMEYLGEKEVEAGEEFEDTLVKNKGKGRTKREKDELARAKEEARKKNAESLDFYEPHLFPTDADGNILTDSLMQGDASDLPFLATWDPSGKEFEERYTTTQSDKEDESAELTVAVRSELEKKKAEKDYFNTLLDSFLKEHEGIEKTDLDMARPHDGSRPEDILTKEQMAEVKRKVDAQRECFETLSDEFPEIMTLAAIYNTLQHAPELRGEDGRTIGRCVRYPAFHETGATGKEVERKGLAYKDEISVTPEAIFTKPWLFVYPENREAAEEMAKEVIEQRRKDKLSYSKSDSDALFELCRGKKVEENYPAVYPTLFT